MSCKTCLLFSSFLVTKTAFKALLTCNFIHLLLNSFDLPNCSSESRKRYTLKMLLMGLEALGEGFPVLLGETGRGLAGNRCLY